MVEASERVDERDDVGVKLTVAWATVGVLAILADAAVRLAIVAVEGLPERLGAGVLAGYALAIAIMVYAEAYRGFHKSFAPAFAARAATVAREGGWVQRLAAPLIAMGLFGCDRSTHVRMWTLTAFIVGFVVLVRAAPHPIRSMIDAGVSVALVLGSISVVWHVLRGRAPDEA